MSKYLGQYFLINKDKLLKIVEALDFPPKADQPRAEKNSDTIIEIGPGHGELTSEIVSKFKSLKVKKFKIIAIEKDIELADSLKKWSLRATEGSAAISEIASVSPRNDGKIEIIQGDALRILSKITNDLQPTTNDYKIVGNIPYYITGYLLRILGELENKPSLIILTIQKEVAERVCAEVGKMNLLAASVRFWAKPEIIGYISRKDFQPAPEVDSAITKLTTYNLRPTTKLIKQYYKFIKILFKQPRKTIINNLRPTTNDPRLLTEKLKLLDIDPRARPQDLSVEKIKQLSKIIKF